MDQTAVEFDMTPNKIFDFKGFFLGFIHIDFFLI